MRTPSVEVRTREAQRLLDYGANLPTPLGKQAKKDSGAQSVKKAKTSPQHPKKPTNTTVSSRPVKGKKPQAATFAPDKKDKPPPSPRRILPQTACLPVSVQGNELR